MAILSDLKARNIKPKDRPISDGTVLGLRLEPGKVNGRGKWTLRFVSPVSGKRRDMGLSTYPDVSITQARKLASTARDLIREGKDPIDEREAEKRARQVQSQIYTFQEAAAVVHKSLKAGWSSARHGENWISSLEMYVFPHLGRQKVNELKPKDFANALRPIWINKADTASRIKQRCSAIMDWCVAEEIIELNPVAVADKLLPKQRGARERVVHQPSMAWANLPGFVESEFRNGQNTLSKLMLEFLILTAARSGEVRAMTWDEVDLGKAVWTVPATRMKAKAEHRVPLSIRAVEILTVQQAKADHPTLVFPSIRGKVPSDMILSKFLRDHNVMSSDVKRTATAHGFRSSFRNWVSENGYPRDYAERALSHTIRNQAEAAYHTTDLLDQRRDMMEAWSQHVCGTADHGNKVVHLSRAGK
ncbi:MAG: tyrosine-type recombinase/integrase [Rhodospirillales bacterium]|nr:tyrosine-type recombinase/integrase [Rhodospirillales bacterium]